MTDQMTRVIHTGDTHVGYRQYHSPARRRDFLAAFERVIDDAVEGDVDAVIHAGDLFHDRRPDLPDLLGTLSALRRLDDADVPFLAVVGNHESTRGGQWLDLFENLGLAVRLGVDPHRIDDVAFYGLDHVPRSKRDGLDYRFDGHDAAHAVLVGHGLFTPFAHADWETETVLNESDVAFDAMLLGDNHTPDTAEVEGVPVTYCGSTERASASERAGRRYNVVEFDAAVGGPAGVEIRQRALDTREFVFVGVELGEGEGTERVRERVRQHDLEDTVVIVEVTGDGETVTPADVEQFAAERGALIARVTDRREREADAELSVSFADPDEAVRERVRELGLSEAALGVDETVRSADVADANVRERTTERVRELLEDGAADAFAPADDPGAADGEGLRPSGSRKPKASGDGGDETDGDDPATGAATDAGGDGDDSAEVTADPDGDGNGSGDGDGDASAGAADGADGQVSMGDYS